MGKPTGFLEYARKNNFSLPPLERIKKFQRVSSDDIQTGTLRTGSALYELRRTLLPIGNDAVRNGIRMSSAQSDSRME